MIIGIAVITVGLVAVPVEGSMAAPTWTPGDYWEYVITGPALPVAGTLRLDVVGTETVTVGGVPYACYRLAFDQRFAFSPPMAGWINGTGVVWYRTSDFAGVAQIVNVTVDVPPFQSTLRGTAVFDPPERIQWPLTPGDSWIASGWLNTSLMIDVPPPMWTNTTVTVSFSVLTERPVTVPAGTFATTPLSGMSAGGENLTFWSPIVGNGVLLQALDPTGAEMQRFELTSYRYQAGATNAAPSVTLTRPIGGEVWSGGTVHDIAYVMSDADDASLDVTLEWSDDGGATWSPIGSFLGQGTGGYTYPWTVPPVDVPRARLRVCASDGVNPPACAASTDFRIDSTAPTALSSDPGDGAMDVPLAKTLSLTFSEAMDAVSTEAAISVSPSPGTLSFAWRGNTLDVTHAAFQPATTYTVTVATSARDESDPGNALATAFVLTFRTVAAAAVTADAGGPYAGRVGDTLVLDGTGSAGVIMNYTWMIDPPIGANLFLYGVQPTFIPAAAGTYAITLTVRDASGKAYDATTTAAVAARDTTPPVIRHTPLSAALTGEDIVIEAEVTDAGPISEVRLVFTPVGGTEQNVTMTSRILPSGVRVWSYAIPAQAREGVVAYRIYAIDAEGNIAISPSHPVTVRARPSAPPADITLPLIVVLVAVVLLTAVLYLWRRARKEGEAPPPSPPEPPSS